MLEGCQGPVSDPQTFEYLNPPVLEMPNVFTPNTDSDNPKFKPMKYANIRSASLTIVDRWGKRVYWSQDLRSGWDGGDCSPATYFYWIDYLGYDETSGTLKGWVQLIR